VFLIYNIKDDFEILQKAYVDLDIAKTIALSAKSNMKRRKILLRSARRRNKLEEVEMVSYFKYKANTTLNYKISSAGG
jgi:hypothetical protein